MLQQQSDRVRLAIFINTYPQYPPSRETEPKSIVLASGVASLGPKFNLVLSSTQQLDPNSKLIRPRPLLQEVTIAAIPNSLPERGRQG